VPIGQQGWHVLHLELQNATNPASTSGLSDTAGKIASTSGSFPALTINPAYRTRPKYVISFQNCVISKLWFGRNTLLPNTPKKVLPCNHHPIRSGSRTSNMKNDNQLVSNLWPLHSNDSSSDTRGSSRGGLEEKQGIEK
jgi:hypothetical protein